MASCHTHATLQGDAAVPAAPTEQSCPPTEHSEFTEASGRGYSPTDFTDAHRSLGCVLPPNLCTSVQSVGVFVGGYGILPYPRRPLPILPQNSQNSQKLLAQDILPQISQMLTDQEGMASCHTHATLCQSSHRFHRIHRNDW